MILEKKGKFRTLSTDRDSWYAFFIIQDILRKNAIKDSVAIEEDDEYRDMFYQYKDYTLDEIRNEIRNYDNEHISDSLREKLLNKVMLQEFLSILVMTGRVILNDVIGDDSTYTIVPKYLIDSNYTRYYSNIRLGNIDRVLLISDTHIGDEEHEDFALIDYVFSYVRDKYNISTAIHLGDVFHGIRLDKGEYAQQSYYSSQVQEILDMQLDKFKKYFPDYMNVIAIEGNHDTSVIEYLNHFNYLGHGLNELYLSILKPNFHMLRKRENGYMIYGPNMNISLSHPLRFNIFFPYVKTDEIDKENDFTCLFKNKNTDDVDLLLSGHFHYNLSYSIDDSNDITRRIFEVVPSLSKLSSYTDDKCVSKILRFIYDINGNITHFGVTPLYLSQQKIVEGDEKVYQTNNKLIEKNSEYKR